MELIGKQIGFPGAYWEGSISEEEKKQLYKCTVRDNKLYIAWSRCLNGDQKRKDVPLLTGCGPTRDPRLRIGRHVGEDLAAEPL